MNIRALMSSVLPTVIGCALLFPTVSSAQCFGGGEIRLLAIDPPVTAVLNGGATYDFTIRVSYRLTVPPPALIWAGAYDTRTGVNIPQQQHMVILSEQSGSTTLSLQATVLAYDGSPVSQIGVNAVLSQQGYGCSYVYASARYSIGPVPPSCQVVNPGFYHQFESSPVPQPYFGLPPVAGCETTKSGCALLSASNMLRSFGNPLLAPYVPTFLDDSLKSVAVNGYVSSCDLLFDRIPAAANNLVTLAGGGAVAPSNLNAYLDQHFCQEGNRAILHLKQYARDAQGIETTGPHFVFVTGKGSDGDWRVFDPGWSTSEANSLNAHFSGFTTYKNGQPTFRQFQVQDVRLFASNPNASPGALSIQAFSPVELLVTDPEGRRLGLSDGVDVFEIPKGSYFRDFPLANDDREGMSLGGDSSGRKTAYVAFPEAGGYRVDIVGTALGTYTLEFRSVAEDGTAREIRLSGVANVGSAARFAVGYSSDPGSAFDASRVTTFESSLSDIDNSLRLGLIDNQGIAKSLSQKLRAAQGATGPARNDILRAFANEVKAQSGKHISGIASDVLQQDADSLISEKS
jgi:hypothetical protein